VEEEREPLVKRAARAMANKLRAEAAEETFVVVEDEEFGEEMAARRSLRPVTKAQIKSVRGTDRVGPHGGAPSSSGGAHLRDWLRTLRPRAKMARELAWWAPPTAASTSTHPSSAPLQLLLHTICALPEDTDLATTLDAFFPQGSPPSPSDALLLLIYLHPSWRKSLSLLAWLPHAEGRRRQGAYLREERKFRGHE
jgi:hypothetical protein